MTRFFLTMHTALILAAVLIGTTGCSVAREPLPVVEPTYSIRQDRPAVVAADLWPDTTSLRSASVETQPTVASRNDLDSLLTDQ